MIKSVVKSEGGMVMVFDENGEQIPKYQGEYSEVKEKVLLNAPLNTTFYYARTELEAVKREEW